MEEPTTNEPKIAVRKKKSYVCELIDTRQAGSEPEATRIGGQDSPFTGYVSQTLNRSRSPDSAIKIRLTHDTLGTVEIGWAFSHGKVKANDKVKKLLQGERYAMHRFGSELNLFEFLNGLY